MKDVPSIYCRTKVKRPTLGQMARYLARQGWKHYSTSPDTRWWDYKFHGSDVILSLPMWDHAKDWPARAQQFVSDLAAAINEPDEAAVCRAILKESLSYDGTLGC